VAEGCPLSPTSGVVRSRRALPQVLGGFVLVRLAKFFLKECCRYQVSEATSNNITYVLAPTLTAHSGNAMSSQKRNRGPVGACAPAIFDGLLLAPNGKPVRQLLSVTSQPAQHFVATR
jgi:hypothetical protein